MHIEQTTGPGLETWQHKHEYFTHEADSERNTARVIALTAGMMVVEIAAGSAFGSMALLADGWHMSTHAAALGITLAAYRMARRLAHDRRFAFGAGKVGVLGGYTSAVALLVVALLMAVEGVERLMAPQAIAYNEAIGVAALGLAVNLASAGLLKNHSHGHEHEHEHAHEHARGHEDHNLKAAYLHVLADALTSLLAIGALLAGKALGWNWLDAATGLVGAGVIARWALNLLRDTGKILLDHTDGEETGRRILERLEALPGVRVVDLHVWKISSFQYAAAVALAAESPRAVEAYRAQLAGVENLAHVTVEVHACKGPGGQ